MRRRQRFERLASEDDADRLMSRHASGSDSVHRWHWDLLAEAERQRVERRWYRRLRRWVARRVTG